VNIGNGIHFVLSGAANLIARIQSRKKLVVTEGDGEDFEFNRKRIPEQNERIVDVLMGTLLNGCVIRYEILWVLSQV
jgi:hypothetical protein